MGRVRFDAVLASVQFLLLSKV